MLEAKDCQEKVFGVLDGIIQEHLERPGDGHAEDLLDVLLKIHKDGGVDMDVIKILIFVSTSYIC